MTTSSPASRLVVPALCVAIGTVLLAAAWLGAQPWIGVVGLAIMVGYAGFLVVLGRRSETVRLMGGSAVDERWAAINVQATAFAGVVVIVGVLVAFVVEIANGRSGAPYSYIGALAGLSYMAGLLWLRARS